ncbi:MAG: hypothetical protein MHM6MM_005582 [Cercozoa sp. M6MM]
MPKQRLLSCWYRFTSPCRQFTRSGFADSERERADSKVAQFWMRVWRSYSDSNDSFVHESDLILRQLEALNLAFSHEESVYPREQRRIVSLHLCALPLVTRAMFSYSLSTLNEQVHVSLFVWCEACNALAKAVDDTFFLLVKQRAEMRRRALAKLCAFVLHTCRRGETLGYEVIALGKSLCKLVNGSDYHDVEKYEKGIARIVSVLRILAERSSLCAFGTLGQHFDDQADSQLNDTETRVLLQSRLISVTRVCAHKWVHRHLTKLTIALDRNNTRNVQLKALTALTECTWAFERGEEEDSKEELYRLFESVRDCVDALRHNTRLDCQEKSCVLNALTLALTPLLTNRLFRRVDFRNDNAFISLLWLHLMTLGGYTHQGQHVVDMDTSPSNGYNLIEPTPFDTCFRTYHRATLLHRNSIVEALEHARAPTGTIAAAPMIADFCGLNFHCWHAVCDPFDGRIRKQRRKLVRLAQRMRQSDPRDFVRRRRLRIACLVCLLATAGILVVCYSIPS